MSCTTSYVSSIWMVHSTGHSSMSYLFDWSILIWEHGSIYVAVHGGACSVNCMLAVWIHPLLNTRWSLRRRNVWDNQLIVWNYGGIYLFSRSSSWCYPKPRTEFRYWNIQWSLDLLGVGTGSIRPELESMKNEVKNNYDLVVQFDTLIRLMI